MTPRKRQDDYRCQALTRRGHRCGLRSTVMAELTLPANLPPEYSGTVFGWVCQRHIPWPRRTRMHHDAAQCVCPCWGPGLGCPLLADGPFRQCEPCAANHPDGLPAGEVVIGHLYPDL